MALMIGRRPGQQVRIGAATLTVVEVSEQPPAVSVSVQPGGAHTFKNTFETLWLRSEGATVQARPHPNPRQHGAAQLRITAPACVRIERAERNEHEDDHRAA